MESFLRSWLSGTNWPAKQECFFRLFPGERRQARSKRGAPNLVPRALFPKPGKSALGTRLRSAGGETRDEGSSLSFNRLKKLEEITPVLQARYESPWRRGGRGYLLREKELLMRMLLLQLQMERLFCRLGTNRPGGVGGGDTF